MNTYPTITSNKSTRKAKGKRPKPKIKGEKMFPKCPRTGEGKCHCANRPKPRRRK